MNANLFALGYLSKTKKVMVYFRLIFYAKRNGEGFYGCQGVTRIVSSVPAVVVAFKEPVSVALAPLTLI